MGLALSLAVKSLFGRKGRTLFSILGVAVGIATVVGVFTLDHSTLLSRTIALDPTWGGADIEVRPAGTLEDPRAELLALEGVAGVAAFFQNDARVRPLDTERAPQTADGFDVATLYAMEALVAPSLGVFHVDRGRALRPGAREALIGRALAEDYGLEPGDRMLIAAPRRAAKRACVEGEMQEVEETAASGGADAAGAAGEPVPELFEVAGVLAFEAVGRRAGGRVVIVDYPVGQDLYADLFVDARFWVARDEEADLEGLEASLASGFSFEHNARSAAGQMADERAFRNGVRVAGLFALLLGLFVIFHTLSMSLLERLREVGTLHSLGATLGQIGRVFFFEALFIAGSAGVLGLLGGLAFAWVLLSKGISTLGMQSGPVRPFSVPWRIVVPLVAVGVGVALLGSVYPILRARGTDVVSILRGERSGGRRASIRGFQILLPVLLAILVPGLFFGVAPLLGASDPVLVRLILIGLAVLGVLIGLPLFFPGWIGSLGALLLRPLRGRLPLTVELTSRSLQRGGTRIGASVTAVALVAAAFTALRGMTLSLVGEFEEWGAQAVKQKLWIGGLPDVDVDTLVGELEAMPGVVGVENGDVRVHADFLMIGLDPTPLERYGPLGDPALYQRFRDEQAAIVSTRLAEQRQLAVGDKVLLNTSGHEIQAFEILAISDAYGYFPHPDERAFAVTDQRHLKRFFCVDTTTTSDVSVRLDDPAAAYAVGDAVRARYPGRMLRLRSGDFVVRAHVADIRRDFFLFDVILSLTAALAVLGILNGLLLAALERRKELGILRALGTTDGQLASTVLFESGVIGLLGGAIGVASGLALTPVVISSLRMLSGLNLPPRNAGAWCVVFLGGSVLLAIVGGLYPIRRMRRMNAVEAVRS